eukprot:g2940.t1
MSAVWTLDSEEYDFSAFFQEHPGGDAVLRLSRGTDVSLLFHQYHPRCKASYEAVLQRYHQRTPARVPAGLSRVDRELLAAIHARLQSPGRQESEGILDLVFIVVILILVVVYMFIQWRALIGGLDFAPFAVVLAVLRICLTTAGKYCIPANTVFCFLCDLDYSCSTLTRLQRILLPQEVRMDKIYGLMRLPCILRIPAYFLCSLNFPLESFWTAVQILRHRIGPLKMKVKWTPSTTQCLGLILIRGLLIYEWFLFWMNQKSNYWFSQFLMTTCLSFVLLICDLEDQGADTNTSMLTLDDFVLTEAPFFDCFITAGLSCRQLHWILPYQWSPFSNITSESIVREVAEEKGIQLGRSVNLITNRLPVAFKQFLLSTEEEESPWFLSLWKYLSYATMNQYRPSRLNLKKTD